MHALAIISALALAAPAIAHPGMGNVMEEIQFKARAVRRQEERPNNGLIGDLVTEGVKTPVGQVIADILTGKTSGQLNGLPVEPLKKRQDDPTEPVEPTEPAPVDPCAIWGEVSRDLTALFLGPSGRCNDNARAAVRMGFHDAFSGGADGSLLMDFGEENYGSNNGLQDIRLKLREIQAARGVGFADLAQFAHNHATVTCPLGPQIRTFVGRPDATVGAPDGLLPSAFDTADNLIALFAAQGFTTLDLAALLGAHTTGRQFHHDEARAGTAFDSTPGVWDVAFYNETIQPVTDDRHLILPSDLAIATSPQASADWNSFVGQARQGRWNFFYSQAYSRMQMLGVPNINDLTECTTVLPAPRRTFDFVPGEFVFEK